MERRVLAPRDFLERLEDELDRGRRYGRPFSVVAYRSPPSIPAADAITILDWAATVVREHVRLSDAVGLFQRQATLALLLPEADVKGARVTAQRFIDPIDRLTFRTDKVVTGWSFNTATFPEDAALIRLFHDRFRVLTESRAKSTGAARRGRDVWLSDLGQDIFSD